MQKSGTDLSSLGNLNVDNVFIYVADAVREDSLPESIDRDGLTARTISASIHSPTSFASIVTGTYLPNNGVYDFSSTISESQFRLFDLSGEGFFTRFVNTIGDNSETDPIFSVLNCSPENISSPFEGLTEPFIIMERSSGGHAPYGEFTGSAQDYFYSRRNKDIDEIKAEYIEGIEKDAGDFEARLNELKRRGLLEDTLVVYTSDHGELIGEGGMFGHNGPVHPKLVYVPTVFLHPQIDGGRTDSIISHVDLLPTINAVLDVDVQCVFDGVSLTEHTSRSFACTFYENLLTLPAGASDFRVRYEGVFDSNGGYGFRRSSMLSAILELTGYSTVGPQRWQVRAHFMRNLRSRMKATSHFDSPKITEMESNKALLGYKRGSGSAGASRDLTREQQSQLEDLGYL